MHEQHHGTTQASPHAPGERPAFTAPRLELPRFQLAPRAAGTPPPGAQSGYPYTPAPAPAHQQHQAPASPATMQRPTWQATATAMPQPVAVQYATPAPLPAHAFAPVAPSSPAPQPRPRAAMATASPTAPARVSWERLDPPPAERTLLQRISPVHMGVLMVMVMVAMVVTSGPAAMSAKPARLPALASGGGTGDPMLQPRAGATAVAAATVPATRKATAKAAAQATPVKPATRVARRANPAFLTVGNARVRRAVRAGGIPSPAAAANLAIAGGGRVRAESTGDLQLKGIPSAAASEQLGPEQTLPYRPDDGVTLPRATGERDSHAVDTHYGSDVLPMEAPVELPAMTPGAAAEQAMHQATRNAISHGTAHAPNVAGGLTVAQ